MIRVWQQQEEQLRQLKKINITFIVQPYIGLNLRMILKKKRWVVDQRNSRRIISMKMIINEAIKGILAEEQKIHSFSGSENWFMK